MGGKNQMLSADSYKAADHSGTAFNLRFMAHQFKQEQARELLRRLKLYQNSKSDSKAAHDFMQHRIDWTDDVVNRYGLEIVPIEQIERESKRRGWIKE